MDRHGFKLAIFNKAAAPVRINMTGLPGFANGRAWWLKAPAIDSLDGVTFGGSRVDADGAFHPRAEARDKYQRWPRIARPARLLGGVH